MDWGGDELRGVGINMLMMGILRWYSERRGRLWGLLIIIKR